MTTSTEPRMRPASDVIGHSKMEVPSYVADRRSRGPVAAICDESLIVDDRSGLSPAEAVENRLSRLLSDSSLPVSHLQMRGLVRNRFEA